MKQTSKINSHNSIAFEWEHPLVKCHVKINLPKLDHTKFKAWADWGEIREYEINAEHPISIRYHLESDQQEQDIEYLIEQNILKVTSPISAAERIRAPFSYDIIDKRKKVLFQVSINENGEPVGIKVYDDTRENLLFENNKLSA